ncbi:hypothetical protein GVAV_003462 [Gurleya vavrai]
MKFLVTSDNHLGYKELDSIRCNDSFNTFEEILQIANTHNVDLILQGGDLFHDNNPSRNTLIKTISHIKKYTFGNKDLNFESNVILNTNDPNLNVSVPIIAIHGNHDDPSGILQNSSLEILKAGGLINYIGKFSSIESLEIEPVLINQNDRKVAIYGIGNIKDKRLYKLFMEDKIVFRRPDNYQEYVNILVLHQNRVKRGDCDYIPPELVDDWFDVVVYGHEHDPVMYSHNKGFTVLQCGSTIRTSLSEGELGEKFVYLFEIEEEIKITKIALKSVRNFVMKSIKLFDEKNLENKIKSIVDEMIFGLEMPLVRLRVEINGEAVNKGKFGLFYRDKIANYNEILLFNKKRKQVEETNKINERKGFEDVLQSFSNKIELKALPESLVVDCIRKFINNNDKEVFNDLVSRIIKNSVEKVNKEVLNGDSIESNILMLKNLLNKEN